MAAEHVEATVTLTHDKGTRPCRGVAMVATLSWYADASVAGFPFQCNTCKKVIDWTAVSGG